MVCVCVCEGVRRRACMSVHTHTLLALNQELGKMIAIVTWRKSHFLMWKAEQIQMLQTEITRFIRFIVMHVYMYIYTHVWLYVCIYACLYDKHVDTYMYICIYIISMYASTYVYQTSMRLSSMPPLEIFDIG